MREEDGMKKIRVLATTQELEKIKILIEQGKRELASKTCTEFAVNQHGLPPLEEDGRYGICSNGEFLAPTDIFPVDVSDPFLDMRRSPVGRWIFRAKNIPSFNLLRRITKFSALFYPS